MEMSSDSLEDGGVMNEMSFTVVVVYRYRRTGSLRFLRYPMVYHAHTHEGEKITLLGK